MGELRVRLQNGTWATTGTAAHPLRLRTPDGGWQVFGAGGGKPLKLRTPDGGWQIITTGGVGSGISGTVFHLDSHPAVGYLVMAGDAVTYTDNQGHFAFPTLGLGTYEVRAFATDTQFSFASVSLTPEHLSASVDFILPTDFTTVTAQLGPEIGWVAEIGEVVRGYPIGNLVSSSESMIDFGSSGTRQSHTVSWLPVPIQLLRTWADTRVFAYSLGLQRIEVSFQLSASSYIWDGDNPAQDYPNVGSIVYVGPASENTDLRGGVTWLPGGVDDITGIVPVIRDKGYSPFVLSTDTVWAGGLTDIVHAGNPIVTHTLPADYEDEAAVYFAGVSQTPYPDDPGYVILAALFGTPTVDFVYQTG